MKPDDPAFPQTNDTSRVTADGALPSQGVSLRAYFAAKAMQGILMAMSNVEVIRAITVSADQNGLSQDDIIAHKAVSQADALIGELNK